MTRRDTLPVDAGTASLPGDLTVPDGSSGLVLFAHGSGSSRSSPRNRHVGEELSVRGMATLLFDLLTEEEAATARWRFDITLLARRLEGAVEWVRTRSDLADLPLGLFGASTGAAAALVAAAHRSGAVGAVVSRGGRPDLAGTELPAVRAPTLLIVGGRDVEVLTLNEKAAKELGAPHEVAVVPGATHLFEEPGALDAVAGLAGDWFTRHLGGPRP
ncbi:MAG: dienelactone hydrolase family protein [Streptosporangiaceae bacterium]